MKPTPKTYLDEAQTRAELAKGESDKPFWERPVSTWLIQCWRDFKATGTTHGIDGCCDWLIASKNVPATQKTALYTMLADATSESRRLLPLELGFVPLSAEVLQEALAFRKKLEIYQGDSIFPRAADDPQRFGRPMILPDGRLALLPGRKLKTGWIVGESRQLPHVKLCA